jgi:hypothetical protein
VNGSVTGLPNNVASHLRPAQAPQRNGNVRADDETILLVGGVQAAPDSVNISAMMRQRVGLLVDVLDMRSSPARTAASSLLRCQSIPASQTGQRIL